MKIFTAAVIAAGFIATTANAQPVSKSLPVSYADLDLSSGPGQRTLEHRIGSAAKSVCEVSIYERDPTRKANSARCHDAAVASARTTLANVMASKLASR